MAANILISIFRKRSRDQNLKKQTNKQNHFSKEFFNEIWFKVGEYE